MPKMEWSHLNHLQLGRYAEYYAKMEFASYGFEVYTSEVDDHGVDFVVKNKNSKYMEVQVKAVRKDSYTFISESKIRLCPDFLICYLRFHDGMLPHVYVIPASVWENPNQAFVYYPYGKPGQKSNPEYGINCSKKNESLLDSYAIGIILPSLIDGGNMYV